MNNRKNRLILLSLGLCIALWLGINSSSFNKSISPENLAVDQKPKMDTVAKPLPAETVHKNPQEHNQPDIAKPFTVDRQSYIALTNNEVSTLKSWMDDRGYLRLSDLKIYEGYSEATLLELAKHGDLKALETLSSRAIDKGDKEKAILYINLGIVHGSTAALERLTLYTTPNIGNEATEEQRRPAVLETLAVIKVLSMRGDKYLSTSNYGIFIRNYKRQYNVDLVLEPTEEDFVANRAQEIYDKYQAIRTEMGLGDFDNSEPSGVKKFFGFQ